MSKEFNVNDYINIEHFKLPESMYDYVTKEEFDQSLKIDDSHEIPIEKVEFKIYQFEI